MSSQSTVQNKKGVSDFSLEVKDMQQGDMEIKVKFYTV